MRSIFFFLCHNIYFLICIFYILLFFSTEKLYDNKDVIEERHRHRYEINPEYIQVLEAAGLKFVGELYCIFTHNKSYSFI